MTWSNGKGRGTKYGAKHQAARAQALKVTTSATPCVRCGHPLGPEHTTSKTGRKLGRWHWDHNEQGGYLGFSHGVPCPTCGRNCNVRAGSQKGAHLRNSTQVRGHTRTDW